MPGRSRPAPAPHPRKATKTARFLDMATERHGSLASIPLDAVAGLSAELAPRSACTPAPPALRWSRIRPSLPRRYRFLDPGPLR